MRGARPLEHPEVEQLLREGFTGQFKHRNRSLFAIGVSTGFRCSELLALTFRDVIHRRYPKDWIKINKRHTKGKTQGRTNQLQPFAKKSLQPWIEIRREQQPEIPILLDAPVFLSREINQRTGEIKAISLDQAGKILRAAFKRCDITGSVSTHTMRKTFAKIAYRNAVKKYQAGELLKEPIFVVKDLLGHKHLNDTLKYLSFLGSQIDEFDYQF